MWAALSTLVLYVLTTMLGLHVAPWVAAAVTGFFGIMWMMGIISDPTSGKFLDLSGIPLWKRFEDHTIFMAAAAWLIFVLSNLNAAFMWWPKEVDYNMIVTLFAAVLQAGGFFKTTKQVPNEKSPAANIPPVGGITDGVTGGVTELPQQGGE